ncbi:MAG: hypothetical protein AB7H86_21770 [Blastocatellales bacterium]
MQFDAEMNGKGSFLLLDARSDQMPPAGSTIADWAQHGSSHGTISGGIEFPIGNVAHDVGVLVFSGDLVSANTFAGKVSFFRAGQDPKDPNTVPVKTGWFTATRSAVGAVTSVSAASYGNTALAGGSIVAAFGSNLASETQAASAMPLPTSLAGTMVAVRVDATTQVLAPIFFVSPTQINYQIPDGVIADSAAVIINNGNDVTAVEMMRIAPIAPGLFTANASGQGVAAAVVLRVKADGEQSYEPVAKFDAEQKVFVPVPIDLGQETDQVFLILYGTGIRNRSSLGAVNVTIGGTDTELLYAGSQEGFAGLDQVNVRLPRSLKGRGEVDVILTGDGASSNSVKISVY